MGCNFSPLKILSSVYPDYDWLPWHFQKISANEWRERAKKFMETVAKELKIATMEDWYNVTREDIKRFKEGNNFLKANKDSLFFLLTCVFPEYKWLPWKVSRMRTFWSVANQKQFVDFVAKELNVTDWHNVTAEVNKAIFFCVLKCFHSNWLIWEEELS